MNAENIASYFTKKIAKPIHFDIGLVNGDEDIIRRYYAMEPTAVVGNSLHVLLSIRFQMNRDEKIGQAKYCGEAEIPFEDGDTLEFIFDMAVAGANFGENSLRITAAGRDEDRIATAYKKLQSRLDATPPASPRSP
jgi:hypothetical protein